MANIIEDEVFLAFATYAIIAILKMLLMGPLTVYFRITRKSFSNTEDAHMAKNAEEKKKMLQANEDVERVRRCHQNDLENIVPFVLIGSLYVLTGPSLSTALLHFRAFLGLRVVFTVAYLLPLPHPFRGLSYIGGTLVMFSMALRVLSTVLFL